MASKNTCPRCGKNVCPICDWAIPDVYRTLKEYRHAYTPNNYHKDDPISTALLREFRRSISSGPDCAHEGDKPVTAAEAGKPQ